MLEFSFFVEFAVMFGHGNTRFFSEFETFMHFLGCNHLAEKESVSRYEKNKEKTAKDKQQYLSWNVSVNTQFLM